MPQLDIYRQQVGATNTKQVVRQTRDDGSRAQAIAVATDVGVKIANDIETARAKGEIVRASSSLRREYDAIYRELEADGEGDYDKFEERFNKRAEEARGKVLKGLKTSTARNLMGERAIGMEDDYAISVRSLQRTRGVEEVKATVSGKFDELATMADDTSVPLDQLIKVQGETKSYVDDMKRTGFLNDVEAETYAQGMEKAIEAGRMSRAKDTIEQHIRADRIEDVNDIIAQFDSKADKDALKQYRDAVQQDLRVERDIAEAEENKRTDLNNDRLDIGIVEGKVRRQDVYAAQSRGDIADRHVAPLLRSILAEQERREREAKEGKTDVPTSKRLQYELQNMGPRYLRGYDEWSRADQLRFDHMRPEERLAVEQDIATRRETGRAADTVDGVMEDLMRVAEIGAPSGWRLGKPTESKQGRAFRDNLRARAAAWAEANGDTKIPEDELRREVAYAMKDMNAKKYPVPADIRSADQIPYSPAVDPDLWAEIEGEYYRMHNRKPTNAEVSALMGAVLAGEQ